MCGDLFIAPKRISKIDRVGAGAFATVDICELRSVDGTSVREVAVKRLRPECFTDKDTVKDFVLEVMVMARLQHSYVAWYHVALCHAWPGASCRPWESGRLAAA